MINRVPQWFGICPTVTAFSGNRGLALTNSQRVVQRRIVGGFGEFSVPKPPLCCRIDAPAPHLDQIAERRLRIRLATSCDSRDTFRDNWCRHHLTRQWLRGLAVSGATCFLGRDEKCPRADGGSLPVLLVKENRPSREGRLGTDDTRHGAGRHCHGFQKRAGTSSLSFRSLGDALAVPKSDATLTLRGARRG
jgi:hypothetical protein